MTFETQEELAFYLEQEGIDTSTWSEEQWEEFACMEEPSEPELTFPAEYNIQALAIEIKKAIDASEPKMLKEGKWHLPFVDQEVYGHFISMTPNDLCGESREWQAEQMYSKELIDISAARCYRYSYGNNLVKTVGDDLALAKMLRESNHWSPFEHQAQAISPIKIEYGNWQDAPKGCEIRIPSHGIADIWSRNFQGYIQARALLDT